MLKRQLYTETVIVDTEDINFFYISNSASMQRHADRGSTNVPFKLTQPKGSQRIEETQSEFPVLMLNRLSTHPSNVVQFHKDGA